MKTLITILLIVCSFICNAQFSDGPDNSPYGVREKKDTILCLVYYSDTTGMHKVNAVAVSCTYAYKIVSYTVVKCKKSFSPCNRDDLFESSLWLNQPKGRVIFDYHEIWKRKNKPTLREIIPM